MARWWALALSWPGGLFNQHAVSAAAPAAVPVPQPIYDVHMLAKNSMKEFSPRSAIEVAQGSQLSWPIAVRGNFAVDRVSLTLRNFYHHSAKTVSFYLEHDGVSAVVAPTFGNLDNLAYGHTNKREVLAEKQLRVGKDYTFSDGNFSSAVHSASNFANLALHANATQSSTHDSFSASLAVDGDVFGLRSEYAISMTTGEEAMEDNGWEGDDEPWWQVDLGSVQSIGTIVLWSPEAEPTVRAREVQSITVRVSNATESEQNDHWFTLKFSYGATTYETSAVDFGAAACGSSGCSQEDLTGESLQAKLQELPNLWRVEVERETLFEEEQSGATKTQSDLVHVGYTYRVTFFAPVRHIPQLQLGDYFDFGASVGSLDAVVSVATELKAEVVEMPYKTQDTASAYVLVSDKPFLDNATLESAVSEALWHKRITYSTAFREQKVLVGYDGETPVEGRYVRVQVEGYHRLQFAEVEVFAEIANVVRNYHGGSPIRAGEFVSESSLSEAFRFAQVEGPWILRLVDETDPTVYTPSTNTANEIGALNDWVLRIQDTDGTMHEFYTGISTEVQRLPACGRLFKVLANNSSFEEIVPQGDSQRLRDRCTVRGKEHVAAAFNKVLPTERLLYVPDADFSGRDLLSFRTVLAGQKSEVEERVELAVKPCREQICTRVIDTVTCRNPEPDCDLYESPGFDSWVATSQVVPSGRGGGGGAFETEYDDFRLNSFDGYGEAPADAVDERTSAQEIESLGLASEPYEDLGPGFCRSSGQRIEMCYYTDGYETDQACQSLCTTDDDCQAYAFGVWPGSREGTLGATLNSDDDDDDIESPWEQDNYIVAGTAGWCLAYTTAACSAGGVKANVGLPGTVLIDSDDVRHPGGVDGSSGDGLFEGCMKKVGNGQGDFFCWSRSEEGYCDDSLELVSYSMNLEACKQACLTSSSNTGQRSIAGCTGVAFAASGYCYTYDQTADVAECSHWYPRQEASIAEIDSFFIQPCATTKQQNL